MCLGASVLWCACTPKSKGDAETTPAASGPAASGAVDPSESDTPEASPNPEASQDSGQSQDANFVVKPWLFAGEVPEGLEAYGELELVIAWLDRHGQNALVVGRKQNETEDARTTTLRAEHWLRADPKAEWQELRVMRERVDACQFDTELSAIKGDWSVTDLDEDGVGEATVAWRVGCRSDVSPVGHKVIMIEYDGKESHKWGLRGDTHIWPEQGEPTGFRTDPEFKSVPRFYKHASWVWEQTSVERFD